MSRKTRVLGSWACATLFSAAACGLSVRADPPGAPAAGAGATSGRGGAGGGTPDGNPILDSARDCAFKDDPNLQGWPFGPGCELEYRAYRACRTGAGGDGGQGSVTAEPCEAEAIGAEACFVGTPLPATALEVLRTCFDYCRAQDACSSSGSDCLWYGCLGRPYPPTGFVAVTPEGCARPLADYWACVIDNGEACNQPGRCEDQANADWTTCLDDGEADPSVYRSCAGYCIVKHDGVKDPDAVQRCIETQCFERPDGRQLEELSFCCHAALFGNVGDGFVGAVEVACDF